MNIGFLPILGLNAQPVAVAASAGSEADAGEGGEGLQSTGDDGLLTGGWQDDSTQHLAFYCPTAQEKECQKSDECHTRHLCLALSVSLSISLSLSLFLSLPRMSSRWAKWSQVCRSQSRASPAASYPAINSTIKTQPCQIHPARS